MLDKVRLNAHDQPKHAYHGNLAAYRATDADAVIFLQRGYPDKSALSAQRLARREDIRYLRPANIGRGVLDPWLRSPTL